MIIDGKVQYCSSYIYDHSKYESSAYFEVSTINLFVVNRSTFLPQPSSFVLIKFLALFSIIIFIIIIFISNVGIYLWFCCILVEHGMW